MQKFLQKILTYTLPIALLAIGLELYVESIPNSYTYKRTYMEQHAADIQTLVLGSSYAYDGIDTKLLDHAFNLANSSQCFEDDYLLLQRYITHMDSLKRVILPLSYSSLQMVSSSNRRGYYTIYMDLYPRWPISKYSFECFNLELMIKKIISYILQRDVVRCDSLGQRVGHTLADRSKEQWQSTEALILNDHFLGVAAQPYIDENQLWLHRMTALCQAHDVALWLIAMPMMEDYRIGMPVEQIAIMQEVLKSIDTTFECVTVLDYQGWGTEDDFWNATHLNTTGAQRFTEALLGHF